MQLAEQVQAESRILELILKLAEVRSTPRFIQCFNGRMVLWLCSGGSWLIYLLTRTA